MFKKAASFNSIRVDKVLLLDYLLSVFTELTLLESELIKLSECSFRETYLNFKPNPSTNSDRKLKFIKSLCNGRNEYLDRKYFSEVAKELVFFNNLKVADVDKRMNLFQEVLRWLMQENMKLYNDVATSRQRSVRATHIKCRRIALVWKTMSAARHTM